MILKPMLASDVVHGKINFPCIGQPKIDGVRAMNIDGSLFARSLKPIRNNHVRTQFSQKLFTGLDGELAAQAENHPDLCRLTTSATSEAKGSPFVLWWVFDDREYPDLPYADRLQRVHQRVASLQNAGIPGAGHLRAIPYRILNNLEEYLAYEDELLDQGFEGIIIRSPIAVYKFGRSTVREAGLLRGKRFIDFEFQCTSIEQGNTNENVATTNELGHTTRSTHQENMVPNGMLGKLHGIAFEDVVDPSTGNVVIKKGQEITVGPGNMPHDLRRKVWLDPGLVLDRINKAKFFPKGLKDKPRFPTWVSVRDATDM